MIHHKSTRPHCFCPPISLFPSATLQAWPFSSSLTVVTKQLWVLIILYLLLLKGTSNIDNIVTLYFYNIPVDMWWIIYDVNRFVREPPIYNAPQLQLQLQLQLWLCTLDTYLHSLRLLMVQFRNLKTSNSPYGFLAISGPAHNTRTHWYGHIDIN